MSVLAEVLVGAVVALLVVAVVLFKLAWRVAEPDEALVLSGFRTSERPEGVGESMSFRIVTGRGCLVLPGVTKVRRLSLEAHESSIPVQCVSQQKIPIVVKAVVVYKVGDDFKSIANAARRFLDRPATDLETKVQNVFVGHLRAISGSMTIEDMVSDQDLFASKVREKSGVEMESFGLVIDSFQIQSIADSVGYLDNLAVPHQAEVQRDARIRRATADQAAVEAEQAAQAKIAEATRTTAIAKAQYQAETDVAEQEAAQQGPLAQARARQAVVEQETRVAELQAQQKEMQLQVEVRKPADAKAYEVNTLAAGERDAQIHRAEAEAQKTRLQAQAEADQTKLRAGAAAEAVRVQAQAQAEATRLNGVADGDAITARGEAEGKAIQAKATAEATGIQKRAEALASNQEAVIAQQIAEHMPEIVKAAASAFDRVGSFTVFNGTEGVVGGLGAIVKAAGSLVGIARESLMPAAPTTNGHVPSDDDVAQAAEAPAATSTEQ